jgi:pyruvate formate lyase activating enzyme
MIISGFHKFTLIDYPNKISAIIFLQGCNFRCGFCHNPELVISKSNNNYSKEFILKFLEERKEKLDAVCITGGEPLISLDLDFLKEIKNRGYSIKIDTNGSYPDKLQSIITAELVDYVAMDIKSSFYNYNFNWSKVNRDSLRIVLN